MSKNTFIKDIFINIIATLLPLVSLQLFSLPLIAKLEGGEIYGSVIFLISVFTIIAFPLGNVLNNSRLLLNTEYEEKDLQGDFNFFVSAAVFVGITFFTIFSFFYNEKMSIISFILILLIIILYIMREYFIVSFRLTLSFKKILFNNIFLGSGYVIGTLVYSLTRQWEFIYLIGLLLSNIYIFSNSNLHKESFSKTPFFKTTLSNSLYLYSANVLKNLLTHADKLLLFPLLGPVNVAVYYTASIIGKVMSMLINPANTVILSYLVREKEKKSFSKHIYIIILVSILGYFSILIAGPYFLRFFYNQWAVESISILKYTAGAAVVSVISSLLHPFNLRFNKIKWQFYINGSYLIIYLVLAVSLTYFYGLKGFSIAVLIASIYNLLIQILIYNLDNKLK